MGNNRRARRTTRPRPTDEQMKAELIAYARANGLPVPKPERPRVWELMDSLWLYQFRLEVLRFCAFWAIAIFGLLVALHLKFGFWYMLGHFGYYPLFATVELLLLLMVKYTLSMKRN